MENNLSTSHFSRTVSLKAIWLLLAGLVLVEVALNWLPEGLMMQTMHSRMREIVTLPAAPVQIMGDSVAAGISASTVAEVAGLPAGSVSNYSLHGTSPMFAWFTLQRELAAGRAPRYIIYAPHPANLSSPMVDRFLGRFATPSEAIDLLRNGVPISDWLFGVACRLSYTMRNREELQTVVTQGNLEFFRTMSHPVPSVLISLQELRKPPTPDANAALYPAGSLAPQLTTPFSIAKENEVYIDKFCALAAEHHIQIGWVSLPMIAALKKKGAGNTEDGKYFAYLKSVAARHPNVTIVHREIEVMPDSYFGDPWHLNLYGTWVFSHQLGDWIRPWIGGDLALSTGKR